MDASEAARQLGKIVTAKRTAARQANMARLNATRQPAPCDCGRTDGSHGVDCPVYKRAAKARSRAKQQKAVAEVSATARDETQ